MATKTEQAPTLSAEEKAEARKARQREQKARKRAEEREANGTAEKIAANEQDGVGQGSSVSEAAQAKPARRPREPKPSAREQKYGAAILERSKLARTIDGYKAPTGLAQHAAIAGAVKARLGSQQVTPDALLAQAGVSSVDELTEFARSEGGRSDELKALVKAVPEEVATRPRHVAASLVAWIWQLEGKTAA